MASHPNAIARNSLKAHLKSTRMKQPALQLDRSSNAGHNAGQRQCKKHPPAPDKQLRTLRCRWKSNKARILSRNLPMNLRNSGTCRFRGRDLRSFVPSNQISGAQAFLGPLGAGENPKRAVRSGPVSPSLQGACLNEEKQRQRKRTMKYEENCF